MINRISLMLINAVIVAVNGSAYTLRHLKNYPLKAWEKAQVKVQEQKWIGIGESVPYRIGQYFKQVRVSMGYRSYYAFVTRPLKIRYKQLKKKT